MRPFISIVTVVYNAGATLEDTILSVVKQSFLNYEYIIIDGGSNDNTLSIINKYKSSITKIVSEPDQGIYDAMNKSLKHVKGKWILFLGGDDLLFEGNTLENVSKKLKDESCIYYGDAYFKNRRKLYDGKFSKFKLALRNLCHQSVFYPSEILHKKVFSLQYRTLSDYAFNLQLYKAYRFKYINLCVSIFNDSASSANSIDEVFEEDKFDLIKENLGWVPYLYARSRRFIKNTIIAIS